MAAKQASLLKMLPMPGGEALVEQGVAEGARLVGGAELGDHVVEVEVRGEDVGTEAGELGVDRDAARGQDAQGRAAELDRVGRSPPSTTQAEVRGRRQRSPRR